jgi:hypothetical protein
MFALTRIIGDVPVGALQPNQIEVVGDFACAGTSGGVPIELRLVGPGVPTTTFTATTSTGAPGMPPVNSVVIIVPWTGFQCSAKVAFEVRGLCNGQWTAWQRFTDDVACFCPHIANVQVSHGACTGSPPRQTVTVSATVITEPSSTTTSPTVPVVCTFGDGGTATLQVTKPAAPNVQQTITFQHDYDPGSYSVCLKSGECSAICVPLDVSCGTCCDEVTLSIVSQPCLPLNGGPATVSFSAAILPVGCSGNFEWKVTDLGTNTVLQPYTPGSATFSRAFAAAGTYKVNVRVQQDSACDDPVLTDSVTFTLTACSACAVNISGPTQTPCTDSAPTAQQTFTATPVGPFTGQYTWEVRKSPSVQPIVQSTGGATFSTSFPGPGTYTVSVSIQTQGCTNPTASSSVQVTVPSCSCPPGQHLDANGNCVPDDVSCPQGQHRDANGNCVPDDPPPPATCPPGQILDSSGNCVQDHRMGCDALLWIALILIAISGVLGVVGCILFKLVPAAFWVSVVMGIIAAALLVIGLGLLILWAFICARFTACSVIIAALNFMGVLIAVFGVVAIILGLIAKFGGQPDLYLCMGASFFNSALWGLLLWILYRIAVDVGCVTENPNGPPPPKPPSSSSSSSGLTSGSSTRGRQQSQYGSAMRSQALEATGPADNRAKGLGDYVEAATKAMGIKPCAACHERARRLNSLTAAR